MKLGDLLEIVAALLLTGAAALLGGTPAALTVAGIALFYFGQNFAEIGFPRQAARAKLAAAEAELRLAVSIPGIPREEIIRLREVVALAEQDVKPRWRWRELPKIDRLDISAARRRRRAREAA